MVRARTERIDWGRFRTVLRRHRVEGLVSHAFSAAGVAAPPQLAAELAAGATVIARQNLVSASESLRIARLFGAAGIPFLFVKGATLDMLAYGTLALKKSRDVDVAVAPDALAQACALLAEAGYERVVPGPEIGPEGFPAWVRHCKETAWKHERTGVLVELHSGLVDNPDLLRGVDVHAPRRMVEIGPGVRLPTLEDAHLFAYLCVHGAAHAWSRLKWLADLAAFLSRFSPEDIEELYRNAAVRGAGRSAAQALILCTDLFGTRLPSGLEAELKGDGATRLLVATALHMLGGEEELDDTILGTVPIHLSHLLLGRGMRFKLSETRRKLRSPHDRAAMTLPRWLRFTYPLLALPSWLWRRIRGPAAS